MKAYLVKGKVCYGDSWQNITIPAKCDTAEEAIMKAKWKYRKADKFIIKSVYEKVWSAGRKEGGG